METPQVPALSGMSPLGLKISHGQESVDRARNGHSIANDLAVISAFADRGISATPREDVFTFWGWKALGRSVKKGEHGVKITTWITKRDKNAEDGELSSADRTYPKNAVVFHVSQTEFSR